MKSVDRMIMATAMRKAATAGAAKGLGAMAGKAMGSMAPAGGSMGSRMISSQQGRVLSQGMQQAAQRGLQVKPLQATATGNTQNSVMKGMLRPSGQPNAITMPQIGRMPQPGQAPMPMAAQRSAMRRGASW